MKILAYGEDSLTLWALNNKLPLILNLLTDNTDPSDCIIFFRPSFGRSGGSKTSQFGEFDFIIFSNLRLYLGESKWDKSPEIKDGVIELRNKQVQRHKLFESYVDKWYGHNYTWDMFWAKESNNFSFEKPLAPKGSLLANNLETILTMINRYYQHKPDVKNVLLYLHDNQQHALPNKVSDCFVLVNISYSDGKYKNSNYVTL